MALYYGPIYQDSEYDATSDSEEDIIGWKPPKRARKKKIRKPVHPPLWQKRRQCYLHSFAQRRLFGRNILRSQHGRELKMSMVCKRWYNLSISSISSITEFMTAPDEYVRCGLFDFLFTQSKLDIVNSGPDLRESDKITIVQGQEAR